MASFFTARRRAEGWAINPRLVGRMVAARLKAGEKLSPDWHATLLDMADAGLLSVQEFAAVAVRVDGAEIDTVR